MDDIKFLTTPPVSIATASGTYSMPANGYLKLYAELPQNGEVEIKLGSEYLYYMINRSSSTLYLATTLPPLRKGTEFKYTRSAGTGTVTYFPFSD